MIPQSPAKSVRPSRASARIRASADGGWMSEKYPILAEEEECFFLTSPFIEPDGLHLAGTLRANRRTGIGSARLSQAAVARCCRYSCTSEASVASSYATLSWKTFFVAYHDRDCLEIPHLWRRHRADRQRAQRRFHMLPQRRSDAWPGLACCGRRVDGTNRRVGLAGLASATGMSCTASWKSTNPLSW